MRDEPSRSAAAARLLDGPEEVAISLIALSETAWTLLRVYAVPRGALVDGLLELIAKANVRVLGADKPTALRGEACLRVAILRRWQG